MSYNEQLQRIVKKYEDAGNPLPATAHDIAIWAIEQRLGLRAGKFFDLRLRKSPSLFIRAVESSNPPTVSPTLR